MCRITVALIVALVLAASGWSLFGWEVSRSDGPAPSAPRTLDPVVAISCEQALARAGDAEVARAGLLFHDSAKVSRIRGQLQEVTDKALEHFRENCPWPK